MSFVPAVVAALVVAAVLAARFTRIPDLALRGIVAAIAIAAGAAGWSSGLDAAVAGLTIGAGVLAAFALPRRGAPVADLGLTVGAVGALIVALAVGAPVTEQIVLAGPRLALLVGCGAAFAVGAGFLARGAMASRRINGGGYWLAAAAIVTLAIRRLCAAGPGGWTVNLPAADSAGEPAFWLVDFGQGVPITLGVEGVGTLGMVGAAALALAGVAPLPRAVRYVAGALGGAAALAAAAWLLTLDGRPVDVDPESIKTFLTPLAVPQALQGGARPLGQAPFLVATHLATVPLALLAMAGLTGLTAGIAGLVRSAPEPAGMERLATALDIRDAVQWGTMSVGVGAAIFLVAGHDLTGIWGPASAAEHLVASSTLALAAVLAGLHGLGGRIGAGWNWLRGALVAMAVGALSGALGGGLVSALGAFEMP